jgi:hypothetical protein
VNHAVQSGRCRRLARGQGHVEADRLAGEFAQQCLDAAGVLIADPVELEAVRNPQGDHRAGAAFAHFAGW